MWRLPLPAEYRKAASTPSVADMKNIGGGDAAARSSPGSFLQEFVGDGIPWAHLDIAGTASSDADDGELTKGGTGFATRLLVELAERFEPPAPGRSGAVGRAGRGGAALTTRPERALEAWMTRRWGTRPGHD